MINLITPNSLKNYFKITKSGSDELPIPETFKNNFEEYYVFI